MVLLTEKEGMGLNCSKEDLGKTLESIALRIERPEETGHLTTIDIQEEAKKYILQECFLGLMLPKSMRMNIMTS